MTTAAAREVATGREERLAVVDCDGHPFPPTEALLSYLPSRWSDYVRMFGLRTPTEYGLVRTRRNAMRQDAWPPSGGLPGSDPDYYREDFLDTWGIDVSILNSLVQTQQSMIGGNQPAELGAALMAASNEYIRDVWLEGDPRLYASILVPFENGRAAVAELERWAGDDRFVQVLVPFRLQKPLGHPQYRELLEAAAHHGLPIAMHPGSRGMNTITGAGWPSYYYEDHVGLPHALLAQMASLVCEGVFDRLPALKIVIQEGGWTWVAPFCWRFDRCWRELRAEVPHLTRKPSEYIRDHFWFTTQPFEEPADPDHLLQTLELLGLEDKLLYSADYPHWDFDPPSAVPANFPASLRRKVLAGNACSLYGFVVESESAPRRDARR